MNMTIWTYVMEFSRHVIVHITYIFSLNQSRFRRNFFDASAQHEIMTKSLNLVQPPRLFVKCFATALCISWSLNMKDELKSFLELYMKINKGLKIQSYLILVYISILTS